VPVEIVPTLTKLLSVVTALLTSVPVVGSVTFVAPVVVNVNEDAPLVVNAPPVVIFPPVVIVLVLLLTPVPPYAPVIIVAFHVPDVIVPTAARLVRLDVLVLKYPESFVHWLIFPDLFVNVAVEVGVKYVAEMFGMSAATRFLKVGVAAPPLVGPAKTVFAVDVFNDTANVPLPVTGDPLTAKIPGTVSPTDVTVPDPLPLAKSDPLKYKLPPTLYKVSVVVAGGADPR
jgi:hypothetical protein